MDVPGGEGIADRPAADQVALRLAGLYVLAGARRAPLQALLDGFELEDIAPVAPYVLEEVAYLAGEMAYLLCAMTDRPFEDLVDHLALVRTITKATTQMQEEPPMPIRKPKLAKARQEIEDQEALSAKWHSIRDTKRAELADLERRIGTELVDVDDPDIALSSARQTIDDLRGQIELADKAIKVADHRIMTARQDALTAVGDELRRDAGQKRSEAKEISGRADRLLAELEALEGCPFAAVARQLDTIQGTHRLVVSDQFTRSSKLTQEATWLEGLATEATELGTKNHQDRAQWEPAMARFDPDGPEARAKADRLAHAEAQAEKVRAATDRDIRLRNEWIERRAKKLVSLRGDHDPVAAAKDKLEICKRRARDELNTLLRDAPQGPVADRLAWVDAELASSAA